MAARGMRGSRSADYLISLSSVKAAPKWSITGKSSSRQQLTPGPGTYEEVGPERSRQRRGSAFGFGTSPRETGCRHSSPGPGQYSPADPRMTSSKHGFGTSQRQGARPGPPTSNPGPGAYAHKEVLGADSQKSSLVPRREGVRSPDVPGPGTYPANDSSDVKMQKSPKFGFGTSPREVRVSHKTPGPGTYDSEARVGGPRCTMTCRRQLAKTLESPGPGAYCGMQTSFGY